MAAFQFLLWNNVRTILSKIGVDRKTDDKHILEVAASVVKIECQKYVSDNTENKTNITIDEEILGINRSCGDVNIPEQTTSELMTMKRMNYDKTIETDTMIATQRNSPKTIHIDSSYNSFNEEGALHLSVYGFQENVNRCRICLRSENLTDIFANDETATIAASIMILCPTVKISRNDTLPQRICDACLQSLRVAIHLKTLGENTDKELRSTIKKRKKPLRETEFIVIDCTDGGEVEENINFYSDDDEFRPPTELDVSDSKSNSDSSYDFKKGKGRRKYRKRRSKIGPMRLSKSNTATKRKLGRPRKQKRCEIQKNSDKSSKGSKKSHCVYCDQTFRSILELREHKKAHIGEKPFKCDVCDRTFKFIGSFKSHQGRHVQSDELLCSHCNKRYSNKTELRRHLVDVHDEPIAKFICTKCKRAFTSEKRLGRHKDANCPGSDTVHGKEKRSKPEQDSIALGRDLFKCVAPLTTTYWSDSFSD